MLRRLQAGFFLLSLLGLAACDGGKHKGKAEGTGRPKGAVPDFRYTTADVTGPATPATTNALPVDIYLDGTYSMQGFAQPQSTAFSRLLEGIEAVVQNAARRSDLRFFKYGRSVAPLQRDAFVAARNSPALWDDKSFRSETNFAQAVDSIKQDRVSIFITDLFYSNADANKVVKAIQDKCFDNGVEMGLMGLKSDFDGYVADVQPAVKVTGERPLYLLVFGSKANINLILSAFRNQPYVQAGQALLLTRYPVRSFHATAKKSRGSNAINKSSERNQLTVGNDSAFAFTWNPDKGNQGEVSYRVSYEAEPYALPITADNLKPIVYRRDKAAADSVLDDQSLKLLNTQVSGGKLTGTAQATLKLEKNTFSAYQVVWQYDSNSRIELPRWVLDNSTSEFSTTSEESAKHKTLALDNFVRSLAVSAATRFQPKYGKLYLVFSRH